jgi:predicted ATPase
MASPLPPLLKSITLQGFLSYGPEAVEIPLTALNVLIGPNGSGKSNLVEALSVLRAVPKDLPLPIRQGGGVKDWLWREGTAGSTQARVEILLAEGQVAKDASVRYRLVFGAEGGSFTVIDERVENEKTAPGRFYFGYENGRPMLNVRQGRRELQRADIDPRRSRSSPSAGTRRSTPSSPGSPTCYAGSSSTEAGNLARMLP